MTILIPQLVESLTNLANEHAQEAAWVRGDKFFPELSELACQAFDDTGLASAIEDGTARQYLSANAVVALTELRFLLQKCQSQCKTTEQIFYSDEMRRIRIAANFAKDTL